MHKAFVFKHLLAGVQLKPCEGRKLGVVQMFVSRTRLNQAMFGQVKVGLCQIEIHSYNWPLSGLAVNIETDNFDGLLISRKASLKCVV